MKSSQAFVTCLGLGLAVACGGSEEAAPKTPALKPAAKLSDSSQQESEDDSEVVPSRCVYRKGACMPPIRWAEKLCEGGVYQDVALYMFRSGTPWTRFYMRTGLNAVNGWGPTIAEDLVFAEEVIPINYRGQSKSFHVEGSLGTFDVLRWNGSCVTLDLGEITKKRPSTPKNSRVDWKEISENMQDALLESSEVERVYQSRRKECKGASIGRVTAECERLDKELMRVIASYVREAKTLPPPGLYP